MVAPKRAPRVCLGCRSLLLEEEDCGCGGRAVAPASPVGWDTLVEHAWGSAPPPSSSRTRRREPARLARGLGALGGSSGLAVSYFATGWPSPVAPIAIVAIGSALGWIVGTISSTGPAPRDADAGARRPRGVRSPRPRPSGVTAEVIGEPELSAPFSHRRCVAWAVWVASGTELLVRDARCAAHALRLDDGGRVDVAAGRIEIDAAWMEAPRFPMSVADELLVARRLHPPPAIGDDDPTLATHPFAGDAGYELCVLPGDRVTIEGPITSCEEEGPVSYREPAKVRLVPAGVPRVSLVPSIDPLRTRAPLCP